MNKTRHLSLLEIGSYWLLLLEYYISGPILARDKQVLRLCRSTTQEEIDAVHFVLAEFFVKKDGRYHNLRADEEIEKRQAIVNKKVEAGRKGGRAKAFAVADVLAHAMTEPGRNSSIRATHSHSHIEPKNLEGGGSSNGSKAPPSKYSQDDFDQRDWRKIGGAKRKISERLSAAVGSGQSFTDEEYWQAVAEESGVTLQRVRKLQKENGGSNES